MSNLPNILLIYTDQHRFDCLGVNGHPLLQTPHLDRLAAEGVNMTHAFCPIPVCIPARNSLFHGQWSTSHLAIANWDTEAPRPAREGLPSWSQSLRQADYWLGYVGKWHVHPRLTPPDYGFHRYVPAREYASWRAACELPPVPSTDWRGGADAAIQPHQSALGWGAEQTIQMLRERAAPDQPFMIGWFTDEPHLPNRPPEPYASMYPPADIPPWPGWGDDLIGKPYIQAQQRRSWQVEGWTWEQWAAVVGRYLGVISLLDAQIGRVLDALDELGLAENTLVIYTADHGDMCGSHGMVDKHFVMYDDIVRVPLILRWPARLPAGQQWDTWVSNGLDLAVTLCRAADAPVPDTFCGRDLLGGDTGRSDILTMYHGNQFGLYSQRMVRDRQFKYVWNATAEDELYDLTGDPGELHNLAGQPGLADELARLHHRLLAWMQEIGDPLLNGWVRAQLERGL